MVALVWYLVMVKLINVHVLKDITEAIVNHVLILIILLKIQSLLICQLNRSKCMQLQSMS